MIAARAQQRSDQIAVGRKIAQQLNRTRCWLELIDAAIQIGQMSCGDKLHPLANLGKQAVLDLTDKVGDIAVVRIERSTRKTGALGERRDVNARKVAAFGKLAGKRLAKGALRAKGPAITFLELGQASSLLLSLCAIAQCEYYCTPCASTRKGNIWDVTEGLSLCHIQ